MPYTRGKILSDQIAFALSNVKLQLGRRFMPMRLTEEQRYDIGQKVVRELQKHGDPWKLDENMPDNHPGPR